MLWSSRQCGHGLTASSALSPQQKCPRSTLMCFAEEAKVLVQEWEDIPINLTRKLKNIARLLKVIYGSMSGKDSTSCNVSGLCSNLVRRFYVERDVKSHWWSTSVELNVHVMLCCFWGSVSPSVHSLSWTALSVNSTQRELLNNSSSTFCQFWASWTQKTAPKTTHEVGEEAVNDDTWDPFRWQLKKTKKNN